MGKILRGMRAMWLSFGEDEWTLLGKDMDDLSIDTNPDTEQTKNVLGETTTTHNGYTPSMSQDYIARSEDSIYKPIQHIADTLAVDDESCKATLIVATLDIEVKDATGEKTAKGNGFKVPVLVTVDNDGGSTAGYTIPFTIAEDGAREQGSVTVTDKKTTFTAGAQTLSASASTPVKTSASSKSLSD